MNKALDFALFRHVKLSRINIDSVFFACIYWTVFAIIKKPLWGLFNILERFGSLG